MSAITKAIARAPLWRSDGLFVSRFGGWVAQLRMIDHIRLDRYEGTIQQNSKDSLRLGDIDAEGGR